MRELNCCINFGPSTQRKEEAESLNNDDGPIATRLRSKGKGVVTSPDVERKPSRHQHDKRQSHHSDVKKSEVHTSSSSRKIVKPSINQEDARKTNHSAALPPRSRQISKGADNSKESKSHSRNNEHIKKEVAHKRGPQAKSKLTINASSPSQVWKEKETSTSRPSEGPSKPTIAKGTRPSVKEQEPADHPVVEASIPYIRQEGFGKATERIGYVCDLCEKDLTVSPLEEEEVEDFDFELEEEQQAEDCVLLPETCVFPCHHAFHTLCLQMAEHLTDPCCPLCLSFSC